MELLFEKYESLVNKIFAGEKLPKILLVEKEMHPMMFFDEIKNDGVEILDVMCLQTAFTVKAFNFGKFCSLEEIKRLVCFVEKTELVCGIGSFLCVMIDMAKNAQKAAEDEERKAEIELILDFLKTRLLQSNCILEPEAVVIFAKYFPNSLRAICRRVNDNEDYSCCLEVLTSKKPEKEFAIYLMENGYVADLGAVLDWLERENFKDEELKEFKVSVLRIVSNIALYGGNFSFERCKKLRKLFWGDGQNIFDPKTIVILYALIKSNVCVDDDNEEYLEVVNLAVNDLIEIVKSNKNLDLYDLVVDGFCDVSISENARMDELCVELAKFPFEEFREVVKFQEILNGVFDMNEEKECLRAMEIFEIAKNNYCNSKKKN